MVKAADAAVEAGFDVRFVSVDFADWAARLDETLVARRRWRWHPVPLRRATHPMRSRFVSARHRAARALAGALTPERAPLTVCVSAYARTHRELVAAILAEPGDLIYGGTVGALAATVVSARRAGCAFALDLEDYHLAESEDADAALTHALAARVLPHAVRDARFVTTASGPMASQYTHACGIKPLVIHNVVPKPTRQAAIELSAGPLSLYWFSQTIAAGRGLEDVVTAVARAGIDAELHLRGSRGEAFVEQLRRDAQERGARIRIVVHGPGPADDMVALCRPHAIGLSLESTGVLNRDVCVSNKVLTYLAAGLAVVATRTQGHLAVAEHAPKALACYASGDVDALAHILRQWDEDRALLRSARCASLQAAERRFHWEHPLERDALVDALVGAA
jgi:glycosyltransferase involved in cell wall biosynthesis